MSIGSALAAGIASKKQVPIAYAGQIGQMLAGVGRRPATKVHWGSAGSSEMPDPNAEREAQWAAERDMRAKEREDRRRFDADYSLNDRKLDIDEENAGLQRRLTEREFQMKENKAIRQRLFDEAKFALASGDAESLKSALQSLSGSGEVEVDGKKTKIGPDIPDFIFGRDGEVGAKFPGQEQAAVFKNSTDFYKNFLNFLNPEHEVEKGAAGASAGKKGLNTMPSGVMEAIIEASADQMTGQIDPALFEKNMALAKQQYSGNPGAPSYREGFGQNPESVAEGLLGTLPADPVAAQEAIAQIQNRYGDEVAGLVADAKAGLDMLNARRASRTNAGASQAPQGAYAPVHLMPGRHSALTTTGREVVPVDMSVPETGEEKAKAGKAAKDKKEEEEKKKRRNYFRSLNTNPSGE